MDFEQTFPQKAPASSYTYVVVVLDGCVTASHLFIPSRLQTTTAVDVVAVVGYAVFGTVVGSGEPQNFILILLVLTVLVGLSHVGAHESECRLREDFLRLRSLKDAVRQEKIQRFGAEHTLARTVERMGQAAKPAAGIGVGNPSGSAHLSPLPGGEQQLGGAGVGSAGGGGGLPGGGGLLPSSRMAVGEGSRDGAGSGGAGVGAGVGGGSPGGGAGSGVVAPGACQATSSSGGDAKDALDRTRDGDDQ